MQELRPTLVDYNCNLKRDYCDHKVTFGTVNDV